MYGVDLSNPSRGKAFGGCVLYRQNSVCQALSVQGKLGPYLSVLKEESDHTIQSLVEVSVVLIISFACLKVN